MDDGRGGDGLDGGRHLRDGVVGRGDHQDVDAARRAREVVVAPEETGEGPAARRERGGERPAGPAGTDDPDGVHLTSFGVPAPVGCRSPTDDPNTFPYRLPTRVTSPPAALSCSD